MLNEILTDLDFMALIEVVIDTSIKCFIPILLIIVLLMVSMSEELNTDPSLKTIEKPSGQPNIRPDIQWTRTTIGKFFIFDTKDSSGAVPISMFLGKPHTTIRTYRVGGMIHKGVHISTSYNIWHGSNVMKRVVNTAFIPLALTVNSKGTPLLIDRHGKAFIIKVEDPPLGKPRLAYPTFPFPRKED